MADSAVAAAVRWLEIDRDVRRRITRSVRTGVAVSRPDDAGLAAGYCSATLDWLSQRRHSRPFQLTIALVVTVELLATQTILILPLLGTVFGLAFLRLRTPALRRRLTVALRANAQRATEAGVAPVRIELPGHGWLNGRRRRRLVIGLTTALVLVLWLLIQSAFLIRTGGH
jgi:hypothetical protein